MTGFELRTPVSGNDYSSMSTVTIPHFKRNSEAHLDVRTNVEQLPSR